MRVSPPRSKTLQPPGTNIVVERIVQVKVAHEVGHVTSPALPPQWVIPQAGAGTSAMAANSSWRLGRVGPDGGLLQLIGPMTTEPGRNAPPGKKALRQALIAAAASMDPATAQQFT